MVHHPERFGQGMKTLLSKSGRKKIGVSDPHPGSQHMLSVAVCQ
jgi:hypothetical protein